MAAGTEEPPTPLVLRPSRAVLLGPVFLLVCVLPLAGAAPVLLVLLVLPVLAVVWVLRVRTEVDLAGVRAVGLLRATTLAWPEVGGVRFPRSPRLGLGGWARAVRPDGTEVSLPCVSFNDLPQLHRASGGRVPDPAAGAAAAAPE